MLLRRKRQRSGNVLLRSCEGKAKRRETEKEKEKEEEKKDAPEQVRGKRIRFENRRMSKG